MSLSLRPAQHVRFTLLLLLSVFTGCHKSDPAPPAQPGPLIQSFEANPKAIPPGGSSILTAVFQNGTGVVQPGNLAITSGVPLAVSCETTTTYSLTVTSASGATAQREVPLQVILAPEPWTPTNLPEPIAARMKAEVDHLADPALEGRMTGEPGCVQAATFIAGQMQAIGLSPINAPVNGPGMGGESPFHFTYKVPYHGFNSSNLVGLIPGTDPVLKDEFIVFSAHYDHIGRDDYGVIVPGANDNASGVAGILEAARILLASNPKRSILFLAVSGEEMGLYGSAAFTAAPPFPVERIVANINLDMIGRGRAGQYYVTPAAISGKVTTLVKDTRRAAVHHAIPLSAGIDDFFKYSDHYSFATRGIPTVFLHDGEDQDYHVPGDTADKIDYQKMAELVRLAADVGYVTANAAERPQLVSEVEYKSWTWATFTRSAPKSWPAFLVPKHPIRSFDAAFGLDRAGLR